MVLNALCTQSLTLTPRYDSPTRDNGRLPSRMILSIDSETTDKASGLYTGVEYAHYYHTAGSIA